jgi:hypothetical protein
VLPADSATAITEVLVTGEKGGAQARAGTEKIAELRRRYPDNRVLSVLYGSFGLVGVVTVDEVLHSQIVAAHP